MPDTLEDLASESMDWRKCWDVLCRRRWWLALPAFVVWALVWSAAWFMPATYRSETLILVEQQRVPEQYVVSNVAADLQERLRSMTQQILSRTRLLGIIEDNRLYANLRTGRTPDELVERMRKDIQIELVQAPDRRELTAFKVAYLSSEPHLAQTVTNQLTSLFIAENLKARQQQSEQTTQFLESQLEEVSQGLSDQERKVKDFKSRYLGELPEQVQSNVQILSGLQTRLQQEMDALSQARQQNVYLESLGNQWHSLESDLSLGRSVAVQAPPALDEELDRLRAQLADLSSHYTEKHPDIRKLKEQITKTEKMKRDMRAQVAAATKSANAEEVQRPSSYADLQAMSPKMQVESQLKANKLEIENRQRTVQQLEKQIDQYQARLNMTPVREQQLAGLTRDYEQSRKNYEQLLAKRDQSDMATNLERRQEGEQFRVLDPPNLPQKPYSPNRLKLNVIGLVAGLVLGIASLGGSQMMDDRIYSKEALEKVLPAPVLSEIPPLPTDAEERMQERWNRFQISAIAAMVVCTSAGFAVTFLFG